MGCCRLTRPVPYAVSVFLSFLAGLSAMAVFSHRERRRVLLAINVLAAVGVAFTLSAPRVAPTPMHARADERMPTDWLYMAPEFALHALADNVPLAGRILAG